MTDLVENIMGEVEALIKSYEEQRKALLEKLRPQFQGIFTSFFETFPKGAVVFLAYTPYFNDGDECEFSVHDPEFFSGSEFEDEEDIDGDNFDYGDGLTIYTYKGWYDRLVDPEEKALAKAAKPSNEIFKRIPDDLIRDLFGDHVRVIITKNGVTVSEYEHE